MAPDGARRRTLLAVGAAMLAAVAALLLKSWCGIPGSGADQYLHWCYSDIPPLYYTERLAEGAVPYFDHAVEYPVLTGLWMWLASALGGGVRSFFWWTGGLLVVSSGATAWLLAREVGPLRALAFAAAPTLMISGAVNWDLPAVALATAGLVAHRRGRDGWAGALLGLGTAAKLYPGLFLLVVAPAAFALRGRRAGIRTTVAAVGAWAAVNVPVALAAPSSWWRFFALSRERPADWDSLATLFTNVTGRWIAIPTLNALTAVALAAGVAAILWATVRRTPPERWHLASLPLLAWFLITSKVYSPQFSLWLLPLFALAFPGWGWLAAFAAADVAVTVTRFPYLAQFVGGGLDGAWPYAPFGAYVAVRAVVLAGTAWRGWRGPETAGRDAGTAQAAAP